MTIALTTLLSLRGSTGSGMGRTAPHGPEFQDLIDQLGSTRVAPVASEGLGNQSGLKTSSLLATELLDLMALSVPGSDPAVAGGAPEPMIVGSNPVTPGVAELPLDALNDVGIADGSEANAKMAAVLALLARPAPGEPAPGADAVGNWAG